MKPMKTATSRLRRHRLLALILVLAMVAAACGGSTETTPDETTATTAAPADDGATETTPAPAPDDGAMEMISAECPIPNPDSEVQIDMMGWEFPIVSQYAAELEECAEGNYSFNVQFLDSQEARNQVTLDVATGEPNFEIIQGSNSFIIELANKDALLPLNDLIDKYRDEYNLDEIDPAFFELGSIDGNIYAVPMVSNSMHVFYNEPVLNQLGLAVPTTFDEALAMCPTLEENGYAGFGLMLSAGWSWQIEFDNVLGSLGLDPVDPVTGQPNWNSPEGIQAANILKDMLETCGGVTGGSYSTDDIQAAFQTGEYVVGQTWASRAQAMDDPEASAVVGEIQFAPALDTGSGVLAAPAYMDGYAIPKGTSVDPEKIFLAIMAATDRESQEAAAAFGGVTRAGVTNPDGPRNGDAAQASFVEGRGPDLTHPAAGIARSKLGEALLTIVDGTSVEDALAAAETAYLEEAAAQGLLN